MVSIAAQKGTLFRGIPFTLQGSADNGAIVTNWAMGQGLTGTVDANGLISAEAPTGQAGGTESISVVATDAWGQTGTASRTATFTAPTVTAALPGKMRGGQAYTVHLDTNLPSPTWSTSNASGGGAGVSGANLTLSPTAVATQSAMTLTATVASSRASASAVLSGQVLPPPTLTAQPGAMLALRGGGQRTFGPPGVNGQLGTLTYVLTKAGADVSDNIATDCPGFSFSRQTGAVTGTPTSAGCSATYAYQITDPGDGVAPSATVSSSTFSLRTQSNTTFSTQPSSLTVIQGATGTVNASLTQDGAYVSPLQFWSVTNGTTTTDITPSWFTKACPLTSATCTVTVAPTTSITPGSYGPYGILAWDGTGYTKQSSNFTVTVQAAPVAAAAKGCSTPRDLYVNGTFRTALSDCSYSMSLSGVSSFTVDNRQPIRMANAYIGGSISTNLTGRWEYGDGTTWTSFAVQGQTGGRTMAYNSGDNATIVPLVTARYFRWTYTGGSNSTSTFSGFIPECFLHPNGAGTCQ